MQKEVNKRVFKVHIDSLIKQMLNDCKDNKYTATQLSPGRMQIDITSGSSDDITYIIDNKTYLSFLQSLSPHDFSGEQESIKRKP